MRRLFFLLLFLSSPLSAQIHLLTSSDESRFFDCRYHDHYSNTPQPFFHHAFMRLFYPSVNSRAYLIESNGYPTLHWMWNLERSQAKKNPVFVGVRGLDWSITKSSITSEMAEMVQKDFPHSPLWMPDNFIYTNVKHTDLDKSPVMAVCHMRDYPGFGFIDTHWPGFNNGAFWKFHEQFFKDREVVIISYSNGASPRHQIFDKVKSPRYIQAMADIETNYDPKEVSVLIDYIWTFMRTDTTRKYYALCGSDGCAKAQHIRMVKELNLDPYPISSCATRWKNWRGNIVIDIYEEWCPPRFTHSSVIHHSVQEFSKMLRQ